MERDAEEEREGRRDGVVCALVLPDMLMLALSVSDVDAVAEGKSDGELELVSLVEALTLAKPDAEVVYCCVCVGPVEGLSLEQEETEVLPEVEGELEPLTEVVGSCVTEEKPLATATAVFDVLIELLEETLGVEEELAAMLTDALRLSPSGGEGDESAEALEDGEARALAVSEGESEPDASALLEALAHPLGEALGASENECKEDWDVLGEKVWLTEALALPEGRGEEDAKALREGLVVSLPLGEALGEGMGEGESEPLAAPLCEGSPLALGKALEDTEGD